MIAQRLRLRLQLLMRVAIRKAIEAARNRNFIDGANAGSRTRIGVNPPDPKSVIVTVPRRLEPTFKAFEGLPACANPSENEPHGYKVGYNVTDDWRPIRLTQNQVAIVDLEDWIRVSRYMWCAVKTRAGFYAAHDKCGRLEYLHRFIMNAQPGEEIDHRDRNGLNCPAAQADDLWLGVWRELYQRRNVRPLAQMSKQTSRELEQKPD